MEQQEQQTNLSKLIKENKKLKEENEQLKKYMADLEYEISCLMKFVGGKL